VINVSPSRPLPSCLSGPEGSLIVGIPAVNTEGSLNDIVNSMVRCDLTRRFLARASWLATDRVVRFAPSLVVCNRLLIDN